MFLLMFLHITEDLVFNQAQWSCVIHIADLSVICVVPTDGGLRPLQKNDKLVLVDINSVLTVQTCEGVTGYAA